jgi:transcriptional regulator with XRE-family HTH domain
MLERINLILKSRNLNAAQFADEIGVQRSSVSHILTGRNNASLDFLLKVLAQYPEIDTDWLLTGKGVMMRSAMSGSVNNNDLRKDDPKIVSPTLYNIGISGDLFKQYIDIPETIKEEPKATQDVVPLVTIEKSPQVQEKIEEQKMPDEKERKPILARQIEKIVIFYTDKTFGEYKAES